MESTQNSVPSALKLEPLLPKIQPRLTVLSNGTLPRRRTQHRKSISGLRAPVEQNGLLAGRWRPAFGKREGFAGFRFALQVIEDLLDYHRIFDAGDDPDLAAAFPADLDVDIENVLQALRPG